MKPPDPATDMALVQAIARGDEEALARLYERYAGLLFNYLLALVDDRQTAEDLLQEVFLAVWQGARRFRGRSTVRTWVYRIAHHRAIDHLRRRRPQVSVDEVTLVADHDPEAMVEQSRRAEAVRRALATLSPTHRAVVELTFVHGLSYREIADVLGCPPGTVKSRMSHALRYLKAALNGQLD